MPRIEKTVFISYRRTNSSWALAIFQNLTQHGYDVFFDFNGLVGGDFERVILENIRARAHFLVLLTPSALDRCGDPTDWLRREIETALDSQRNIVPLMLEGFDFNTPLVSSQLTGKLAILKKYNALQIPAAFFLEAMTRLRDRYLCTPLDAVLHPVSSGSQQAAKAQKKAASSAPAVDDKELVAREQSGAEPPLTGLGKAVANYIFKCWTGKETGVDVVNTIAEVYRGASVHLSTGIHSHFHIRRATRLIEMIGDDISRRFEEELKTDTLIMDEIVRSGQPGYYEISNKTAPWKRELDERIQSERNDALLAIADAITNSTIEPALLFQQKLEPAALEVHISNRFADSPLGFRPAATRLYEKLLREACNYIVEVYITLPQFHNMAAREMLLRESDIMILLTTVLDRLREPKSDILRSATDRVFAAEYLRSVRRRLDWIELFGVDLSRLTKRYQLSISYVRLAAIQHRVAKGISASSDGEVEEILSHGNRHLVLGQAGTGKTTLLQWLAVCATKGELPGSLRIWNGAVPFFIRLRQVQNDFPPPEKWIELLLPALAALAPPQWVHRCLLDGALVLIDGVDEIGAVSRTKFERWLGDLIQQFPKSAFVVTSRPLVSQPAWVDEQRFSVCELRPMGLVGIQDFVTKWFDAVATGVSDVEHIRRLNALQASFKSILRDNTHYRELGQYPLLAAMLCGLHVDRKGHLPTNRMEIYRIALDMFLGRRDEERDMYEGRKPPLDREEMKQYLQDIAYWFSQNLLSEANLADVGFCVATTHKNMHRVRKSLTPTEVLQFLIERTGLIREPTKGKIDFVHKTFQEYLAAAVYVQLNLLQFLIKNAHLDHMREIFVLAVGHGTMGQPRDLINGILDRADKEELHRKNLQILAIACNETLSRVAPSVIERIRGCLSDLLPSVSISDAREIGKVIGDRTELFTSFVGRDPSQVAAWVCSLGVSRSRSALPIIRSYASNTNVYVMVEIFRAWEYFNRNEYAIEVLESCPFAGRVRWRGPVLEYHHSGNSFSGEIFVDFDFKLESLCAVSGITFLEIENVHHLSGVASLERLGGLREISITNCSKLGSVGVLGGLPALNRIIIRQCGSITGLEFVIQKIIENQRDLYLFVDDSEVADRMSRLCWSYPNINVVTTDYSTG